MFRYGLWSPRTVDDDGQEKVEEGERADEDVGDDINAQQRVLSVVGGRVADKQRKLSYERQVKGRKLVVHVAEPVQRAAITAGNETSKTVSHVVTTVPQIYYKV
jgi:hypothetical protein